ncbi:MAG TPA: galactokinase [Azospirillaceae bacterium]|nr:galactokinase [Azospirillaceae bacterium]
MTDLFSTVFDAAPQATAKAPARANLLGEHTDYNDGFVLPTPLPYFTTVSVGAGSRPGWIEAYAARFGETLTRPLDAPPQGDWLDYVLGCVRALGEARTPVAGLRLTIDSEVPVGAGISSSAALEVATLRALRQFLALDLDDDTIARLGQWAEKEYVGMPCGIMDQMVSSVGVPGQALFLDTRDLSRDTVPLPPGYAMAIIHCGVSHQLTDGGYQQRRAECQAAAAALEVASLRDLGTGDLPRIETLPEPLNRRARHVVTENQRVLDGVAALRRVDVTGFGSLMVASHLSQRNDYAVSIPEIDAVVDAALSHGAAGARLTGGGFGGSVVALMAENRLPGWWRAVSADCPGAWAVYPAGGTTAAGTG